jgi:hypothetical protein
VEFALGLLIGLAIGSTGLGGGTITAPALILVLGFSPAHAVGTALLFSCATRLSAAIVYWRRRQVDFRVLGLLLAGGLPGAAAGTMGARWLTTMHASSCLAILGLAVIAAAAFSLLRPIIQVERHKELLRLLPGVGLPIGLTVGFSSAGAGALGTIALFGLTKLPAAAVVGTDLVFGFVIALIGGGLHLAIGGGDPGVLIKLTVGGLAGSLAGSRLAGVLPAQALRTAVLSGAIALGGVLVYKGLEKVL